jgi:hypothetical protein
MLSNLVTVNNVVADTLSRVESITAPPSYDALAASQDTDDELQSLRQSNTALQLEKLPISGTTVSIYCDTSAGNLIISMTQSSENI